jgi:hypothetical protein
MLHALMGQTSQTIKAQSTQHSSSIFVSCSSTKHNGHYLLLNHHHHHVSCFEKLPLEIGVHIFNYLDRKSQSNFLKCCQTLWKAQINFLSFDPQWNVIKTLYPELKQKYGDQLLTPLALCHCFGKRQHLTAPLRHAPVWQTKTLKTFATQKGQNEIIALDATWLHAAATVGNTDLCLWLLNEEDLGEHFFKAFEKACIYKNTHTAIGMFEWLYSHSEKEHMFLSAYWPSLLKIAMETQAQQIVSELIHRMQDIVQIKGLASESDLNGPIINFDILASLFLVSRREPTYEDYWTQLLSSFTRRMNREEKTKLIKTILDKQNEVDTCFNDYQLNGLILELQPIEGFQDFPIRAILNDISSNVLDTQEAYITLDYSLFLHEEAQKKLFEFDVQHNHLERVRYLNQYAGIPFSIQDIMRFLDHHLHFNAAQNHFSIEDTLLYLLTCHIHEFQWITADQTQTLLLKACQAGYLRITRYLIEHSGHITHINLIPILQKAIWRCDQAGRDIICLLQPYLTHALLKMMLDDAIEHDHWDNVSVLLTPQYNLEALMGTALARGKWNIVEGLRITPNMLSLTQWKTLFNAFIMARSETDINWRKKSICHHVIAWIKDDLIEEPVTLIKNIFKFLQGKTRTPWTNRLILTFLNQYPWAFSIDTQRQHLLQISRTLQDQGDIELLYQIILGRVYSNIPLDHFSDYAVGYNALKTRFVQIQLASLPHDQVTLAEQLIALIHHYGIYDNTTLSHVLTMASQLKRWDMAYLLFNLKAQHHLLSESDKQVIQENFALSQSGMQWLNTIGPTVPNLHQSSSLTLSPSV